MDLIMHVLFLFKSAKKKGDPIYSRRPLIAYEKFSLFQNFTVEEEDDAYRHEISFVTNYQIPDCLCDVATEGRWTMRTYRINDWSKTTRRWGRDGYSRVIPVKRDKVILKFEKQSDLVMFKIAGALGNEL